MVNPTPEQLANFLRERGYTIIETDVSYTAYSGIKYSPPFLKENLEIGGDYLIKILSIFGISIEEFKQDWDGGS